MNIATMELCCKLAHVQTDVNQALFLLPLLHACVQGYRISQINVYTSWDYLV